MSPATKTWRHDAWVTVDSTVVTSKFLASISDREWKALVLEALQTAEMACQELAADPGFFPSAANK
jgi:hypothetical protein